MSKQDWRQKAIKAEKKFLELASALMAEAEYATNPERRAEAKAELEALMKATKAEKLEETAFEARKGPDHEEVLEDLYGFDK